MTHVEFVAWTLHTIECFTGRKQFLPNHLLNYGFSQQDVMWEGDGPHPPGPWKLSLQCQAMLKNGRRAQSTVFESVVSKHLRKNYSYLKGPFRISLKTD